MGLKPRRATFVAFLDYPDSDRTDRTIFLVADAPYLRRWKPRKRRPEQEALIKRWTKRESAQRIRPVVLSIGSLCILRVGRGIHLLAAAPENDEWDTSFTSHLEQVAPTLRAGSGLDEGVVNISSGCLAIASYSAPISEVTGDVIARLSGTRECAVVADDHIALLGVAPGRYQIRCCQAEHYSREATIVLQTRIEPV